MIQIGTQLTVIDNSGARKVTCIKIISSKKKYAFIGEIIYVSVKSLRAKRRIFSKVQPGDLYKALVVKTKLKTINKFNNSLYLFKNSVILINKQNKLIGTRIFESIPNKLRYTKYLRILSLAAGLIKY